MLLTLVRRNTPAHKQAALLLLCSAAPCFAKLRQKLSAGQKRSYTTKKIGLDFPEKDRLWVSQEKDSAAQSSLATQAPHRLSQLPKEDLLLSLVHLQTLKNPSAPRDPPHLGCLSSQRRCLLACAAFPEHRSSLSGSMLGILCSLPCAQTTQRVDLSTRESLVHRNCKECTTMRTSLKPRAA